MPANQAGDSSTEVHRLFTFHTHMMGYSVYEYMWRLSIRAQHCWKKYTGGYVREAAEREARRIQDEQVTKMERILAEKRGESLPKDFGEKSKNSPWRLDWVVEEKRSPAAQPPEHEGLQKVKGLDMDFKWPQLFFE